MKLHSRGLKITKLLPLYMHIDMKFLWVPLPYETLLPRFGYGFVRGDKGFPGNICFMLIVILLKMVVSRLLGCLYIILHLKYFLREKIKLFCMLLPLKRTFIFLIFFCYYSQSCCNLPLLYCYVFLRVCCCHPLSAIS